MERTSVGEGLGGRTFLFRQLEANVLFGPGCLAAVGRITRELGARRVMIISSRSTASVASSIERQLAGSPVVRWGEVTQHVPMHLADRARSTASENQIDTIVCVGGGSAIGLAKAVALTNDVQIVAVPTTYSGSEHTAIYGVSADGQKHTGASPRVVPRAVIYDAELTVGLSRRITGASSFNALAHAVESLYAPGCNPVTTTLALEAVRTINRALPQVMAGPADVDARSSLLRGACLAGIALGSTATGMHHKICHVLGGALATAHADVHAAVLPHTLAFLAPSLPEETRLLAAAFGVSGDPAGALWDLAVASEVPTSLRRLATANGALDEGQLAAAAQTAAQLIDAMPPPGNPRPATPDDVAALLLRAYIGNRPETNGSPSTSST